MVTGKEYLVYKLHKALYGLRQAPWTWNIHLDKKPEKARLHKVHSGAGCVHRGENQAGVVVGVYVNDLIVTGEDPAAIPEFK